MSIDIAEKVFKVRGQRSRSRPDQLTYIGGGVSISGVPSRLIRFVVCSGEAKAAGIDRESSDLSFFQSQICKWMWRSRVGLQTHNKSNSWWWYMPTAQAARCFQGQLVESKAG